MSDDWESSKRDLIRLANNKQLIASIIVSMAMFSSSVYIVSYYFQKIRDIPHSKEALEETLEQRIQILSSSLISASRNIDLIEREINQRKILADKLKQDAEYAQNLKNLNAQQVAAIAQTIRGELQQESNSNFWSSVWTNVAFAFLGALFGELIRFGRSLYNKRITRVPPST